MGIVGDKSKLGAALGYWHRRDVPGRRIDFIAVTVFLAVACLWSWLAAQWAPARLPGGGSAPRIDGAFLIGFGPVLGVMAAGALRREPGHWPVGFRGKSKRWSTVAMAAPVLLAAIFGVARFHVEPHLDAAILAASLLLSLIGEEIGWREWLYNALAGLPLWASALATWIVWLAWHVPFVVALGPEAPGYDLSYTVGLLVGSFALAALVRHTRSSGIAAAWRMVFVIDLALWQIALLAAILAVATWKAATEKQATP